MASTGTSRAPATRERPQDAGFTLLELIVAIVVIALLAGIAITAYLRQREKGVDSTLKQDLHYISQALVNASATTGSGYASTAASKQLLLEQGASFSEGNEFQIGLDSSGAYCIRAWNPNGSADGSSNGFYWYDSALGGAQPGPTMSAPPGGACDGVAESDWISPDGSVVPSPSPSPTGGPTTVPTLPGGGGSTSGPGPSATPTGGSTGNPTGNPTGTPTPTETEDPPPANDECADAFTFNQPGANLGTTTVGGTNVDATDDAQGVSSVFWRGSFPVAGWSTVEMFGSGGAKTLSVYRQSGAGCALQLVDSTQSGNPGVAWQNGGGEVYYFVVTSNPASEGTFSLRLHRADDAPVATAYGNARAFPAINAGGSSSTPALSTLFGVPGGSDPEGFSSVWMRVPATTLFGGNPTYTLTIQPPGNGRRAIQDLVIEVYRNGSSAAVPGTVVAQSDGNGVGSSVTWAGPSFGQGNFYIRVRSTTGLSSGDFVARLTRA